MGASPEMYNNKSSATHTKHPHPIFTTPTKKKTHCGLTRANKKTM